MSSRRENRAKSFDTISILSLLLYTKRIYIYIYNTKRLYYIILCRTRGESAAAKVNNTPAIISGTHRGKKKKQTLAELFVDV